MQVFLGTFDSVTSELAWDPLPLNPCPGACGFGRRKGNSSHKDHSVNSYDSFRLSSSIVFNTLLYNSIVDFD